jgi:uncharacterized protein (DUF2336 family)
MNADEATRVRQGASASTSPDVLRALADDPSVTVRASLALNPALPDQVSAVLAVDTDARVRAILSRKLSALTPDLTGAARQRVQRDAVASLTAMVADAALRVRITIAEAVKDLADGPRDIVLRLAYDPAVMVCEPVIRLSPMLTQEDLVTLVATGPPPSTLTAVANRPKIDATVSDALVGTADTAAIRALLANPTAQIREATQDALAAQSEEQTDWQAPLVNRPHLPPRAQRMLAEFVAGHLLEILAARTDLDPKVAQTVRTALGQARPNPPSEPPADEGARSARAHALALNQAGRLDDETILAALRRNANREAAAMLAVKADTPVAVIERACALRSAKGIVSLAWKAGLTAQTAVILQVVLAHLAPDLVLRPAQKGVFPLSEDEMRWHLAFLDVPDRGPRAWTPRRLGE